MKLAEAVREARRRAGVSQREAARLAGVPQSTIARFESGAINARADTIERLLAALGHELALESRRGKELDRTLLHRMLRLSPRERILYAAAAGDAMETLRAATATP